MIPNASDLARRRQVVITVLRMGAVIPAMIGLGVVSIIAGDGLIDGRFDPSHWVGIGVVIVATSIAVITLFFVLPALSRIFVPRRSKPSCPFCDYTLDGLVEPRCPECGGALTPEFMDSPPAHGPTDPEPIAVMRERRRTMFQSILRVIGFTFSVITGSIRSVPKGVGKFSGANETIAASMAVWWIGTQPEPLSHAAST